MKVATLEGLFILGFGLFHFAIPFVLPPNPNVTIDLFATLYIANFVIPGCFTLAILSIIFYFTRSRYPAALLVFLFCGGIVLHSLFLLSVLPPVIIIPTRLILVAGIIVDSLSILAIYDYHRRVHILTR